MIFLKRFSTLIIAFLVFVLSISPAHIQALGSENARVNISFKVGNDVLKINGSDVKVEKPFVTNGVTMVPVRVITEAFGAQVDWNGDEKSITLKYEALMVKLVLGSKIARTSSKEAVLEEAPVIVNEKTMVPLRFISENFGATVNYEDSTKRISITKGVSNIYGYNAAGEIPSKLPRKLLVGLFENNGETWMKSSGVNWNARYCYIVKGWANNWGWGNYDGKFALDFMKDCDQLNTVPVIQYYVMNGQPGGGESDFYNKTKNAKSMAEYFTEYKMLMERIKEFGKPVIVLMEADGYGFLQHQTNSNPNAYAAIAASGLPELSGLPDTVAGWGLAFLQIRKSVGASNALLGVHVSAWASGKDISYYSVTDPLQPEVDKVYNFLAPMGLTQNQTGETYDLLVGDPLDRDSDYYRVVKGQEQWWDDSDTAPIESKSFNRYAEWLRLWNQKSQKRWVLWQIPLGNSNHKNVWNSGKPGEGYKDNRPEYFFGSNRDSHLAKWVDCGVIALLFGAGADGQSTYTNDIYSDGQLFMKSRAGSFLNSGGIYLYAGISKQKEEDSANSNVQPTPLTPTPVPARNNASTGPKEVRYDFETDNQGWVSLDGKIKGITVSDKHPFKGSKSLAVNICGPADRYVVSVPSVSVPGGSTITFRFYLPSGSSIASVQPYILEGESGGWQWTGSWTQVSDLKPGEWNTMTVNVPASVTSPLFNLGVEVSTDRQWDGTCYIDAVEW